MFWGLRRVNTPRTTIRKPEPRAITVNGAETHASLVA